MVFGAEREREGFRDAALVDIGAGAVDNAAEARLGVEGNGVEEVDDSHIEQGVIRATAREIQAVILVDCRTRRPVLLQVLHMEDHREMDQQLQKQEEGSVPVLGILVEKGHSGVRC